jgi:hypothetical protein
VCYRRRRCRRRPSPGKGVSTGCPGDTENAEANANSRQKKEVGQWSKRETLGDGGPAYGRFALASREPNPRLRARVMAQFFLSFNNFKTEKEYV